MSDDRPAIAALNKALNRYGIDRSEVDKDNRVKLDIHHPRCTICGLTEDQTEEILVVNTHDSCARKSRGL